MKSTSSMAYRVELRDEYKNKKPFFEPTSFEEGRYFSVTVTTKGTVLVCGKGVRRSEDQGRTWEPEITYPSGYVVVDTTNGDILAVNGELSRLGRSRDDGKTWTEEDITIKPNLYGHGGGFFLGGANESGITLQYGEHKGRLLLPVRIFAPEGSNAQEHWAYHYNTSIYSDDRGKTWQVSDPVQSGTGEGALAELSDGRIYYNSRSHLSVDNYRRVAWSHDGGHRWVDWQVSQDLQEVGQPFYYKYGSKPSYGICAGMVRVETSGVKDLLLFSMADDPGGSRHKMTVWASSDGARTWPYKRLIYEGPSGYSSMSADNEGNIYLVFQAGEPGGHYPPHPWNERTDFARFNLAWLFEPAWRVLGK